MIRDYKINRTHLWERILLLFIKPKYICDNNGRIFCLEKYKCMFGKTYMLKQKVNIKGVNYGK